MNLTLIERMILANQHKILAKMYPEERQYHEEMAEALRNGYEFEYHRMTQLYRDPPMTSEECGTVIEILGLFDTLRYSYGELEDTSGIEKRDVEFWGFDGNNEAAQYGYADFLKKQDKFQSLKLKNSHGPFYGMYCQMLAEWKRLGSPCPMTKEHILSILKARGINDA